MRATKVFTKPIPPIRNEALVNATLEMNGPNIPDATEKTTTEMINEVKSIEKPSRISDATKSPIAFAITPSTADINHLIINIYP